MSAPASSSTPDPFTPVLRSPELVKRHDKAGWLALFTEEALIEDPVGAGAYVGRERHSKFWDAFIAPNDVTFRPIRDFASGARVVRYVTISTVTPVSAAPFELNALIEYVVEGERLASLRAFWEPRLAVGWHAKQGLRGMLGLGKHGLRMTVGLGFQSAMGFSRALVPELSREQGRGFAERLARAIGHSRDEWIAITRGAALAVASPSGGDLHDAERAWDQVLERAPRVELEESIVAGDHLACVLASRDRSAAALARVERGRLAELRLVWSVR